MEGKTIMYGASDDLLLLEGGLDYEFGCYSGAKKGIRFSFSDGTEGVIKYDGEWDIVVLKEGVCYEKLVKSVDEDSEHTDKDCNDCTPYSDVLVLKEGIVWAKVNRGKGDFIISSCSGVEDYED